MQKTGLELKVGSFVLLGIAFLFIIVFSIGDFYAGKRGYRIYVVSDLAGGIASGASARYAGVEAGRVEEVLLLPNSAGNKDRVKMTVWLPEYVKIEKDARASIHSLGLLGERYLDILPGTIGARFLSPLEILVASSNHISLEQVSLKGSEALDDLRQTLKSIQGLISDETVRQNVKNTLSNSEDLTAELTLAARKTNSILADLQEGRGSLGKLLCDDRLYQEVVAVVEDIKQNPWKLLAKPKEKRR